MKKQLLPPILKNDQGFAIIIFAITIVILIAFGIANIDMGASNKGKETIKNIIQTKGGEELARVLRLKTLKIKERLLVGTSSARSAVEADYRCSSGSSIDTPSSHTVEVVDPQQSIIFICKLSQNSGEDGYLLSAYLKRREEIQKRFSQLFINKRQGSVGFISRVIGSVSRTRDSGENGSLLKHSPLFIGDLITTGSSSTTTLELKDKSSIVLGASTTFKIDDFKFKTKQQRVGVFTATAGFIKAWIRKKSENQRVIFKTNSAAMGIRGTVFSLNVAKLNATTGQFIDDVMLEEGWIELKDINQNVVIAQLKMAYQNASTVTEVDGYTNGYTGGGSTTGTTAAIPSQENRAILYFDTAINRMAALTTAEPINNSSATRQLLASADTSDTEQLAAVSNISTETAGYVSTIKDTIALNPGANNPLLNIAVNPVLVASNIPAPAVNVMPNLAAAATAMKVTTKKDLKQQAAAQAAPAPRAKFSARKAPLVATASMAPPAGTAATGFTYTVSNADPLLDEVETEVEEREEDKEDKKEEDEDATPLTPAEKAQEARDFNHQKQERLEQLEEKMTDAEMQKLKDILLDKSLDEQSRIIMEAEEKSKIELQDYLEDWEAPNPAKDKSYLKRLKDYLIFW